MSNGAVPNRMDRMSTMLSLVHAQFHGQSLDESLIESLDDGKGKLLSTVEGVAERALATACVVENEHNRLNSLLVGLEPYQASQLQLDNLEKDHQSLRGVRVDLDRALIKTEGDLKTILEEQKKLRDEMSTLRDTLRSAAIIPQSQHESAIFKVGNRMINEISKGALSKGNK